MRIRFSFSFELPKLIERFYVRAVEAYHCRVLGRDIRVIPLTRFKFAIVDAEDFERLNKFRWAAYRGENLWYATRHKVLKADGTNRGRSGCIESLPTPLKTGWLTISIKTVWITEKKTFE